MANTINRQISFYRAFFRKNGEEVTASTIFSFIDGLSDDAMKDGNSRCVNVENVDIPLEVIYGTKRESGLPLMDIYGKKIL